MPEVGVFCPGCGRPVEAPETLRAASTRDALLGALAYVPVLPAILFLSIPALRSNRFVRFHSWQSLFFAVAAAVIALLVKLLFTIFSMLPSIGFLAAWLSIGVTFIATVVIWVVLAVKAVQGQSYKLPFLGDLAAKLAE